MRWFAHTLLVVILSATLASCWGGHEVDPPAPTPVNPTPTPTPTPTQDNTAPTITLVGGEYNVIAGLPVTVSGSDLKIGDAQAASWKDETSQSCKVEISFTPAGGSSKTITSGDKIAEAGKLTVKVTDDAGNSSSKEITLTTIDNVAPEVSVEIDEINVIAWLTMTVDGNELKIGDAQAASWKDETSQSCKVEITFTPAGGSSKTITSGEKIAEAGKLTVKVTDDAGNSSSKEISLTTIDNVAPEISVEIDEVNVIAGLAVTIDGGQLKIGDQAVASWKDDYSEECEVSLTYTTTEGAEEQTVEPGSILSNAGKLTLSITDSQGNEAKAEIALTSIAVTGLESLKDRDFQVDSKTSLLEGMTITEGLTLVKTEITSGTTGETVTIDDPTAFTPELPGAFSLTLTLSRPDGTLITETLEGLTIRPLVYSTPTFENADYINEDYSWFNVLSRKTKAFVRLHLLTSYINAEWFRKENMVYIMIGEVPASFECEDIADSWENAKGSHADEWYRRIRQITPTAIVKACGGSWTILEDYISSHSELDILASCAVDIIGGESLRTDEPNYKALKRLIKNQNIIINSASWNASDIYSRLLNENQTQQEWWLYLSSSVNSSINNKNTIVGYNPNQDNVFLYHNESLLPIGSFWQWNRIIPFIAGIYEDINHEDDATTSSYPTAAASSTQGNFLSIIKSNYPGVTLEGANTILIDKYYMEEPYYYKDTDGTIKEGGKWYFIDAEKFLEEEVLRKEEVLRAIDSSASPQNDNALPSGAGLCYSGMGIVFEVDGQRYPMTETNRQTLEEAVKSGKEISWIWSKTLSLKQGGPATPSIEVRYLDTKARVIPDLQLTITR